MRSLPKRYDVAAVISEAPHEAETFHATLTIFGALEPRGTRNVPIHFPFISLVLYMWSGEGMGRRGLRSHATA